MNDLIQRLDAEIATVLATVDPLREQLTTAEANLAKLQAGKAALLGQAMPGTRKTLAMNKRGRGRPATRIEAVASTLEAEPLRFRDLLRAAGLTYDSQLWQILKSRPEWFTQVNGKGSAYTLTEAGRNRHKTPAPEAVAA